MNTIENKALKNTILKVGDSKWLVREAVSQDEARHAIDLALAVGKTTMLTTRAEIVGADVVRLNPDGSECPPSSPAAAPATSATPEGIMRTLRLRKDLEANDTSRDAELHALSPIDKLRELAAWELGSADWADQFMKWAKDCGITVTYPAK